jgi:uncharacterized membrane protein
MIIATIAFVAFLVAVVVGVVWMIKQDTNRPDTEFSLRGDASTLQMSKSMAPAFKKMTRSLKDVENAFAGFNEAYRRSQKKHGVR